jgi:hypothetical protein
LFCLWLATEDREDEVGGMGFAGIELGDGAEFFYSDTADGQFFMGKPWLTISIFNLMLTHLYF